MLTDFKLLVLPSLISKTLELNTRDMLTVQYVEISAVWVIKVVNVDIVRLS